MGPLRNAYLDALGIDRWVSRDAPAEVASIPETVAASPGAAPVTRISPAVAPFVPLAAERRLGRAARTRCGLHRLRRALQDAHADRVRRRQHERGVAGDRRSAGRRGRPPGRTVRRACRPAAQRHAAGDRPATRDGVHRQHPQVPAAGQSRPQARRGVALPAVPLEPDRAAQAQDHPRGGAHRGAEPARHRCAAGAPARQAAHASASRRRRWSSPTILPIYCARHPTSARPGKTSSSRARRMRASRRAPRWPPRAKTWAKCRKCTSGR